MKHVIGLMSGTSLDGVDAALIETDGEAQIRALAGVERRYADEERAVLHAAVEAALAWGFVGDEPDYTAAEAVLTRTHADLIEQVLATSGLARDQVGYVGFHGQTVLHRAPTPKRAGATRQIGNGQALANAVSIPVVFDFRTADIAAGGQGAPLVPLYHQALSENAGLSGPLGILNIGGVANITYIAEDGAISAFDTGPGNGLIDAWCQRVGHGAYDADGQLAARGEEDAARLAELMAHPFFAHPVPKSLDRWDFSLDPVANLPEAEGAATLVAFTADTIAHAVAQAGPCRDLLVTGGGRRNPTLMRRLQSALPDTRVRPVEDVGWRGDVMEAEAFAWLAARVAQRLPTTVPETTGVARPTSGGQIVQPR